MGGNGLRCRVSEEPSARPAPRGFASLLTRSLTIAGVFSHRNMRLLAVIPGESGCTLSGLCLTVPGRFSCFLPPHFRGRGAQTLQAAPHCLFVIFKQIQQKLICLLGSAVAAKWRGSPTGFVVNATLAGTVSTANHQRTHDGSVASPSPAGNTVHC